MRRAFGPRDEVLRDMVQNHHEIAQVAAAGGGIADGRADREAWPARRPVLLVGLAGAGRCWSAASATWSALPDDRRARWSRRARSRSSRTARSCSIPMAAWSPRSWSRKATPSTAGQLLVRLDGSLMRSDLAVVEGQYLRAARAPRPAGGRARRAGRDRLRRRFCWRRPTADARIRRAGRGPAPAVRRPAPTVAAARGRAARTSSATRSPARSPGSTRRPPRSTTQLALIAEELASAGIVAGARPGPGQPGAGAEARGRQPARPARRTDRREGRRPASGSPRSRSPPNGLYSQPPRRGDHPACATSASASWS